MNTQSIKVGDDVVVTNLGLMSYGMHGIVRRVNIPTSNGFLVEVYFSSTNKTIRCRESGLRLFGDTEKNKPAPKEKLFIFLSNREITEKDDLTNALDSEPAIVRADTEEAAMAKFLKMFGCPTLGHLVFDQSPCYLLDASTMTLKSVTAPAVIYTELFLK